MEDFWMGREGLRVGFDLWEVGLLRVGKWDIG